MITVYNANNLAQQWFFQRAYAYLDVHGELKPELVNENKTFLSLESYFASIGTLISKRPEFALIPSDEEPFEINANTRTIKIPSSFAKGVAVAGDDMSEVITFTIDRYFDYVDLAGTEICVQWEIQGVDGGTGISYITLIDLETVPGKIRFGWPLTEKLTQHAGKVNFAIRFFIRNKAQDEYNPSEFNYVLNTIPATINILSGMNLVEPTFPEYNVDREFAKFVVDSQNPALPAAKSPLWNDYREAGGVGKDLRLDSPAAISLTTDDLVLKAQAVVDGHGYIDYRWYFKQGGSDSDYPTVDVNALAEAGDKRFEVKVNVYEPIALGEDLKRVANEQYYEEIVNAEDPQAKSYRLVVGPLEAGKTYYERFTTLTIKPRPEGDNDEIYRDVTGVYWVEAANYVGAQPVYIDPEDPDLGTLNAINHSTPAKSEPCIVPTPQPISLVKEPDTTVFIEGSSVVLEVEPSEDIGNPHRFYTWYRNDGDSDIVLDDNADKIEIVAAREDGEKSLVLTGDTLIPAWYYVDVDSQLNRAITEVKSSHSYRVTYAPVKPMLVMEYCVLTPVMNGTTDEINDFVANEDNWVTMTNEIVHTAFNKGDLIRLRVRPQIAGEFVEDWYFNDELIDNLYTDKISYDWYIIPVDDPNATDEVGTHLNEETIGEFSDENNNLSVKYLAPLNTNYLDVWCTANTSPITSFYCVVTNTLANKEAKFTLEDYNNRIFTIW